MELITISTVAQVVVGIFALIGLAIMFVSKYFFDDTDPDMYWHDNFNVPITRYYDDYDECHRPYVALKEAPKQALTLEDLKALKEQLDNAPYPKPFICKHEGEKADVTEWAAVGCEKVVTYCLDCYQPIDKRTDC